MFSRSEILSHEGELLSVTTGPDPTGIECYEPFDGMDPNRLGWRSEHRNGSPYPSYICCIAPAGCLER